MSIDMKRETPDEASPYSLMKCGHMRRYEMGQGCALCEIAKLRKENEALNLSLQSYSDLLNIGSAVVGPEFDRLSTEEDRLKNEVEALKAQLAKVTK